MISGGWSEPTADSQGGTPAARSEEAWYRSVALSKRDGLPQRCVANADNVATIPKAWLEERIAVLRDERVVALDAALRFSMQLD